MGIVVYNTLSRKKEPFETVTPGKVGIYLCGPTVYKPSHIGHAVGPIIFDAIKRYLVFRGYEVTWVVNITDVEDKLIVEAAKQGKGTIELAEEVTKDYLDAMKALHVDGIDEMPKASECIGDIIAIIAKLVEKDYAYESNGDVYFDVAKDDDYGKLSNRKTDDQAGTRELQSSEKRNPADFALWKASKPEEPEEVKYESPWGKGRPGWHIECSAMSMKILGETFDIHGGGLDLVFPHHENEIAQSESASGKLFAKYWMHNGLTRFNTKKVAKSDASPEMQAALVRMTLHNLLDEYPGELIRFFILGTHYRRPIEYSEAEIESKRKGLDAFYRLFERIERASGASPYSIADASPEPRASARAISQSQFSAPSDSSLESQSSARAISQSQSSARTDSSPEPQSSAHAIIADESLAKACDDCAARFMESMDDDFNTAGAIAALFEFAPAINRFIDEQDLETGGTDAARTDAVHATARLIALARLIGLFLDPQETKTAGTDGVADKAMQVLIEIRQHLRKKKDYETADLIRDKLTEHKITLEDRPDGTLWRAE